MLVLRVSLAAAILNGGSGRLRLSISLPLCVVLGLLSLLLSIGFLTPIASIAAGLFELATLLPSMGSTEWRFVVLSSLNALALSLLGPGAYSLDARLFGRRVIVFPPDRRHDSR